MGGQISWHRPEYAAVAGDLGTAGWDFPLVRNAHEAGLLDRWTSDQARDVRARAQPIEIPADVVPLSTDQLIGRRSTSRKFADAAVPRSAVTWPLGVAVRPLDWDGGDIFPILRVFVHRVEGIEADCYDFGSGGLDVVYAGDMRF
jgi:hypothetical protein